MKQHLEVEVAHHGYRQLYQHLAEDIRKGVLEPGWRLPGTRRLADRLGLSRQTVIAAYQELEADGRVVGQIGRGTFVVGGQSG